MEYASHRVSLSIWRIRIYRKLLATSRQSHITHRSFLNSAQPDDEASPKTETKVNSDTTPIPPSQRLPQSPVLTQVRSGPFKIRKKHPTKEDEHRLAKNPWAVALASPIRMCSATGARIPRDLMGEWGLVKNPKTERNHMLPVGLLEDLLARKTPAPSSSPAPKTADQDQAQAPNTATTEQGEGPFGSGSKVKPVRDEKPMRRLILRMVNRLPLLRMLALPLSKVSNKKPVVARLLPFRWKHPNGPITAREEKTLVWTEDMPEFVLRHMRRHVVRKLERTRKIHRHLGAAKGVWGVLDLHEYTDVALVEALGRLEPVEREECGAVIFLGPLKDARETGDGPFEGGSFSEDVTHPRTRSKIPVFDLSVLLSEADMEILRGTRAPHFKNTALLFIPDDRVSIETMLSLWKLKRFLAEDPTLPA